MLKFKLGCYRCRPAGIPMGWWTRCTFLAGGGETWTAKRPLGGGLRVLRSPPQPLGLERVHAALVQSR